MRIAPDDVQLLAAVDRHGSPSDIADELGQEPRSVKQRLRRLEHRGLVFSTVWRRLWWLSDQGAQALETARAAWALRHRNSDASAIPRRRGAND